MKPEQVSQTLRKIANAIDASEKPDKKLVVATLRKVLTEMKEEAPAAPSTAGK